MTTVHSVSDITDILSNVIQNASTLQDARVQGEVLEDEHSTAFFLRNGKNRLRCFVRGRNTANFPFLKQGNMVVVNGKITLFPRLSQYQIQVNTIDESSSAAISVDEIIARLQGVIETAPSLKNVHVQGKTLNFRNTFGDKSLYLCDAAGKMLKIKCGSSGVKTPPQQDEEVCLQEDEEVCLQGNIGIYPQDSLYHFDADAIVGVDPDEHKVKDAVETYFSGLKVDEFSPKRETLIQFGSRNGYADVVLTDGDGSFAAIAECKGAGYVGHGREQLKSYLSATDTQFGIFANRVDSNHWEFYENRRRNRFKAITRSDFETRVDEIQSLKSRCAELRTEIKALETEKAQEKQKIDGLRADRTQLEIEVGKLTRKEHELRTSHKQRKEKIAQLETLVNDLKSDLLDLDTADPQNPRENKKQGILNWLKNLFSKENE